MRNFAALYVLFYQNLIVVVVVSKKHLFPHSLKFPAKTFGFC